MSQTFVIIGASLAGASAALQLREAGFDGSIVLVGEEPDPPYERPPLSKDYLRGEATFDTFSVAPAERYRELDIDLRLSTRVTSIVPASREVILVDGGRLSYDRLLIATGSSPRHLDVPGAGLAGVHSLRTLADATAIRKAASRASHAVVVGAGWIGSEVTASLRQLGLPVTIVAPDRMPLEKVLGPEVGEVYRDLHVEHGVRLELGQGVAGFEGGESVETVVLTDGRRIGADLVVVGVGARPRVELAMEAGLEVASGILVDERLESSVPGVFAAGDVAEAWHPALATRLRVAHWDNAKRQGRHAAGSMMGSADAYLRLPYFYSDQYDLGMEYRGYAPTWDRIVFRGDVAGRVFIAFWLHDGRVVAAMNANVWKVGKPLTALIESRRRVEPGLLADPAVELEGLVALAAPA